MRRVPIETVSQEAKAHGSHWFDPDTLRFFSGKVGPDAWELEVDGATVYVFADSTRCTWGDDTNEPYKRQHFVRIATVEDDEWRIETITRTGGDDFMVDGWATAAQARKARDEIAQAKEQ